MRIFLAMTVLLSACASRPEVDTVLGDEPAGTTYPDILPLGPLLDSQEIDKDAHISANEALLARARALRTRAAGLSD